MRTTWWKSGDWNALCDVCGRKFKAGQLTKRWDGLMVCQQDWEVRHPQDLIRPLPDQQKLPWTRPESTQDMFVTTVCTVEGRQGVAGYGTANCAIVGYDLGYR